jgi:prepilin-type N-terminal cleavage/methylation domain-containing protein
MQTMRFRALFRSAPRSGYTLLELLVVIVLMGLVAMMSIGRFSQMTTGWRVSRAAQAYGEELQAAYALVGRNRIPVTITLDRTLMEIRISDRNNVIYRKRNLGKTSAFKLDSADVTPSTRAIEIYPPGLAADSLSIVIQRQGKFRRVRMLRGGLVQVCSNPATLNGVCVPA